MSRATPVAARSWRAAWALVLMACAALPLARPVPAAPAAANAPVEWPQQWDGRPLHPLAMTAVEQRFAARFPGHIGRFSDGSRVIVLRRVLAPTRMLHPAADCWRGLGYRIEHARLETDAQQRRWRCFDATAATARLRVCERIEAATGPAFTDASSWFWAAVLGHSHGPWQAITVVEPS